MLTFFITFREKISINTPAVILFAAIDYAVIFLILREVL